MVWSSSYRGENEEEKRGMIKATTIRASRETLVGVSVMSSSFFFAVGRNSWEINYATIPLAISFSHIFCGYLIYGFAPLSLEVFM